MRSLLLTIALVAVAPAARAQSLDAAKWIWGHWATDAFTRPPAETCVLRRTLTLAAPPKRAAGVATADNHFKLFVNGKLVARGDAWERVSKLNLTTALQAGENRLEVECLNDDSPAGFVLAPEVQT